MRYTSGWPSQQQWQMKVHKGSPTTNVEILLVTIAGKLGTTARYTYKYHTISTMLHLRRVPALTSWHCTRERVVLKARHALEDDCVWDVASHYLE